MIIVSVRVLYIGFWISLVFGFQVIGFSGFCVFGFSGFLDGMGRGAQKGNIDNFSRLVQQSCRQNF